jgi:hypothetical protein
MAVGNKIIFPNRSTADVQACDYRHTTSTGVTVILLGEGDGHRGHPSLDLNGETAGLVCDKFSTVN